MPPSPRRRARSGIVSPPNEPIVVQATNSDELANASEINARLIQLYRLDNRSKKREPYTIVRDPMRAQASQNNQCIRCKIPSLGVPITDRCLHPTEEELRQFNIECETTYYHKLLEDGAQPIYPIMLLNSISRNPQNYVQLLQYYQDEDEDFYCIFQRQWRRWKSFRTWQLQMREGFKHAWHLYIQRTRERLRDLHYHGPMSIKWDPLDMDQLSTWVEYWCFELTRYEEYSWYRDPSVQFDMYDRHWQILIWASVLQPSDRRVFIETSDYKLVRETRRRQAKENFEGASSRLLIAQRDELHPGVQGEEKAEEKKVKTQHKEIMARALEHAHDIYQKTLRWDEAIENYCLHTIEYRVARREGQKQEAYLGWIGSQIPRIRARMIRARDGLPPPPPSRASPPFDTTPLSGKRKCRDESNASTIILRPVQCVKPAKKRCINHVGEGWVLIERRPGCPRRMRAAKAQGIKILSNCSRS